MAKLQKLDDEKTVAHRLEDMETKSVHIVDRAANKRRFLVTKKEALEMATPAANVCANESPDAANVSRASINADGSENLSGVIDSLGAELSDEDPAVRKGMRERLQRIIGDLGGLMKNTAANDEEKSSPVSGDSQDAVSEVEDASQVEDASAVKDVPHNPEPETSPTDALSEQEDTEEVPIQTVDKAGRRMSARRVESFRKALDQLMVLFKEVVGNELDSGEAPRQSKDNTRKSEPRSITGDEEILINLTSSVGALTDEVRAQRLDIAKANERITATQKELSSFGQSVGVGNSIPVDGVETAKSQSVLWPLDMNQTFARDEVNKAVSFYDDP